MAQSDKKCDRFLAHGPGGGFRIKKYDISVLERTQCRFASNSRQRLAIDLKQATEAIPAVPVLECVFVFDGEDATCRGFLPESWKQSLQLRPGFRDFISGSICSLGPAWHHGLLRR
jgi:hypothetical protein